jgi:hypothetical protein
MYWLVSHIAAGMILLMILSAVVTLAFVGLVAATSQDVFTITIHMSWWIKRLLGAFLVFSLLALFFSAIAIYAGWRERKEESHGLYEQGIGSSGRCGSPGSAVPDATAARNGSHAPEVAVLVG